MKARTAARELALLAFSQIAKDMDKIQDIDIAEIIVNSVRTLTNDAENEVKKSLGALFEIKEFIETYEHEHPDNLKRPIGVSNIPVPIPMTSDMAGRIDQLIDAGDKTLTAIELAEMSSLVNLDEVKKFATDLIQTFCKNKSQVDEQISKYAKGWNLDRLVRIDRDVLRIAITELLYCTEIPLSVSIDEAVELAKKYSTEESSSFINGILRQVVEDNNLYAAKK